MGDEEPTTAIKNSNEGVGGKCVSVEDLNDALKDDTDESEAEGKQFLFKFRKKTLKLQAYLS